MPRVEREEIRTSHKGLKSYVPLTTCSDVSLGTFYFAYTLIRVEVLLKTNMCYGGMRGRLYLTEINFVIRRRVPLGPVPLSY